jgi:hypothetical protein
MNKTVKSKTKKLFKSKMNKRDLAHKLYNEYKSPTTLPEIYAEIRLMALLGFRDACFVIPNYEKVNIFKTALKKEGFVAVVTEPSIFGMASKVPLSKNKLYELHVTW